MKTAIILAMHGVPPADFPRQELAEFFTLHGKRGRFGEQSSRYLQLREKLLKWPRNAGNDPFFMASQDLAQQLSRVAGCDVIVGFNEFCAPDLPTALEEVIISGATKIIVVTPMMTRGGEHAEKEIPELINNIQKAHPDIDIIYAWPFEVGQVADFLRKHILRFATLD